MKTLDDLLKQAGGDGEVRSGIILGIRMAIAGLKELEISDPCAHHRTLATIVETDRCLPDAVELVTGCRLGNRTLKFRDLGKMAATFVDLKTMRSVRVAARESANLHAMDLYTHLEREESLKRAYRDFSQEELFCKQIGKVTFADEDMPGYRSPRTLCAVCGEGVGFGKHIYKNDRQLCQSCAGSSYFEPIPNSAILETATIPYAHSIRSAIAL